MTSHADLSKKSAAQEAAMLVEDRMTLGIGTGSTARFFIDALAEKIAAGFSLRGVPTSTETSELARAAGVEIIEPDVATIIDLAVDGADEVDPRLNLIKGGGGALLREKIVANAAGRFVVIADNSKNVATLGAFPLPVEIEPFANALTVRAIRGAIETLGFHPQKIDLRENNGGLFVSDGGNLIVDCAIGAINDPAELEARLLEIPGVIECGLFCGMTDIVIFGDGDETSTLNA